MADQFFYKTAPGQPNFSEAVCIKAFEPQRPYPQAPQAILYRARFQQLRAYYTKPVPNTPHPNLPQVYFADDIDFQDKTSGMVEWTRIYCTLPNSWNDFASDAYTFPGLTGIRVPISKVVTQKIVQDYFMVGNTNAFTAGLTNYDSIASAEWTKTAISTDPNSTAVPACAGGSVTATRLIESNTAAIHSAYQGLDSIGPGYDSGAIFIKALTRTKARVQLTELDGSAAFADVLVNLETGLPTPQITDNASYTVAAIGDGWWRVGLTAWNPNANAALLVALADNTGAINYTGDGASSLYAWRGQLTTGNVVPHSSVPPTLTPDNTNYPVASADLIPVKFGQVYTYVWPNNAAAEYLSGSTTPNVNTYQAWVATDSNAANTNIYSIESTDSTLSLWQGSVWLRERHFVKAR